MFALEPMRNLLLPLAVTGLLSAQMASASLTLEQKEEFLRQAKVVKTHGAKKGVTGTIRATLSDGRLTHDASIQTIDEEKPKFEASYGIEMNFRDCYKFNIAAYKLGLMLGLGNIPPSVQRSYQGHQAAWTWWVEDVQMDEMQRQRTKAEPSDHSLWARQYQVMKVFDQLIYNTDRNKGNILYDKDWKLWMVDHTRAFRTQKDLLHRERLERCDRQLLERMKELKEADLRRQLSKWLRPSEIAAILVRRDKLVAYFAGSPTLLYDFLPPPAVATGP